MKYSIVRALKFLAYITILFGVIYAAMLAMGLSDIPLDSFSDFISTRRGIMMITAMLGVTLLYPIVGVGSKKVRHLSNEELIEAMKQNGFELKECKGTKLVFVSVKLIDRFKYRFDDKIEVDNSDVNITSLYGSRRVLAAIIYKLGVEVL